MPYLQAVLQAPRGFVAATAHLGNWELAGRLLSTYGRRIHVLMAPEQDPAIQRFLRQGMGGADIHFVSNDSGAVFVQLLMALRRGDVVAVQMDRATGHRSDVAVPFFGTPAVFPLGSLSPGTGSPGTSITMFLCDASGYAVRDLG